MNERHKPAGQNGGQRTNQDTQKRIQAEIMHGERDHHAGEGAREHHAFHRDIDNAAALRDYATDSGKNK